MNRLGLAAGLLLGLWSSPVLAAARPTEPLAAPLAALFAASASEFGLSETLLMAIAQVESGLNPWAVNVAGRSYACLSREEALAVARAGQSFDVGLMQINRWWLKKYGLSLEAVLEPAANIRFGSWILKQELERWGDLRRAVGAYHSPQPRRAEAYAGRVLAALQSESFRPAISYPIPASSEKLKVAGTLTRNSMKVRPRHE
jgi:soluble lytic murein transglycosylase-like protein